MKVKYSVISVKELNLESRIFHKKNKGTTGTEVGGFYRYSEVQCSALTLVSKPPALREAHGQLLFPF